MNENKKNWWNYVDFFKLTGLLLIWVSAWLFMLPSKMKINEPYFENIWGNIFAFLGFSKIKTVKVWQLPDLLSSVFALILMTILQLRGIFSFVPKLSKQKESKSIEITLNTLSIIVHTLFFTMLVKVFIFPNTETSNFMQQLKNDMFMTIFCTICITGMILGARAISRLLLVIFSFYAIFKNINFMSTSLGIWGFAAIVCAVVGFYLEFCTDGFDKTRLLMDLHFLAGNYDSLVLKENEKESLVEKKDSLPLKSVNNSINKTKVKL